MFSRSIIDDSKSINDTSRVVRITIVSDATTWSVTYDHHSDSSRGVIYDHNIFITHATSQAEFFSSLDYYKNFTP